MLAGLFAGGVVRLGPTPPTSALGAPRYVEETTTAGIDLTYDGSETYDVGGGLAVLDCDDDGMPDVYAAGGANPAALFRNTSAPGSPIRFEPVPGAATDITGVTGAYPVDVDADGLTDLAVLRVGQSVLLRGLGDCRFERADEAWGATPSPAIRLRVQRHMGGRRHAANAGVRQLPRAGRRGRVDRDLRPQRGHPARPDGYRLCRAGAPRARLLRAVDAVQRLGRLGRRDLRVSNDRHYYDVENGQEQLWRFEPGSPPRLYTADDGWVHLQLWGMGIASYDVTGDGLPEVYLTSQGPNTLQTLLAGPAQPTYRDLANRRGIEGTRPATGGDPLPSTAWHPEFQDVNNDGFIDLFVSKGNVNVVPDYATRDPSDLLLGQPDGTFVQAVAGRDPHLRPRPWRCARRPQPRRAARPRARSTSAPAVVWRNVGSGTGETQRRWATGWRPADAAGREPGRGRSGRRDAGRRAHAVAGAHGRGRARERSADLDRVRARAGDRRRRSGDLAQR